MVGSAFFALGALPGYVNLVGERFGNSTFFIGSLFFTAAALVQWMLADPERHSWRLPALRDDWWAAAIQTVGTVFFNVSTLAALVVVGSEAVDRAVWRPDAYGSVCFLVAAALAMTPLAKVRRLLRHGSRASAAAWLNMAGAVAFAVSAVGAYVVPSSGEVKNAMLVNSGTFIGALCFMAAAFVVMPRSTAVRGGVPRGTAPG